MAVWRLTEREEIMKTDDDKLFALYGKLLDVIEKEQEEITENNLNKIEHYGSLKMNLIKELGEISNGETLTDSAKKNAELESVIKKSIALNKANAEAVRSRRNKIMSEISGFHKRREAFRAYDSGA